MMAQAMIVSRPDEWYGARDRRGHRELRYATLLTGKMGTIVIGHKRLNVTLLPMCSFSTSV
ncbi:MAG: hypothetical protein AAGU11_18240, partial [Syntrophobacteraceae bacterium]